MTKFSIIIPVKTGKKFLQQCIDSVLNQTYTNYEIIVLADSATDGDGTLTWLKSLKIKKIRLIISAEEIDIHKNWKRILSIDKAEYFTILGYDDILYPDYLETILGLIIAYPEASLYNTHFDLINSSGEKINSSPTMLQISTGEQFLEKILQSRYVITATGYMMRAADYTEIEGVPVHYPNLLFADFELWLRLTSISYQAVSEKCCFAFRIHDSTTSRSTAHHLLNGFNELINYLVLNQTNPAFELPLRKYGKQFLVANCNLICYRLIRQSEKKRAGLSTGQIIKRFEEYATKLGNGNVRFKNVRSIKAAHYIDSVKIFRSIYRSLKKIFRKPFINGPLND